MHKNNGMKLKVCGMRFSENIEEVARLNPDFMGFIFYPKSKRFVRMDEMKDSLAKLNQSISKVGVFVNQPFQEVLETCKFLHLEFAQLHGNEPLEYAQRLKENGIGIIKVFHITNDFNWEETEKFTSVSDFFLFDTATPEHGGSGKKFDWQQLSNYAGTTPFLLSGGIGVDDADEILKLNHPAFAGIDVNSKFETESGAKDVLLLKQFLTTISFHTQTK